ncbi:MAG: hypothetical protein JWM11_3898 [Planctomycetaceae bacterium]|nr:hypothetical protein [Planctomycetaceae bacterium]
MDPNATLRDLLEALKGRDWDLVQELSEALLTWMRNGGFPPNTIGPMELGNEWHRAVATFVCHAALGKVRAAHERRSRKRGG